MAVAEHEKKLNEFGLKLNMASWYIGISAYQEKNISEITGSLRDDFEQGSSFRVLNCLQEYGLQPSLSPKKGLKMVQMSRGNDLAFLFFLLEGYYRSSRDNGEFNTNERLLMTAIAKLDILPTMRALDRILPPPQYGSFEVQQAKDRETEIELRALSLKLKHMKSYQPKAEKKSIRKKIYKLPYFEKQPRPKQIPLRITSKPQDLVVGFPFWPRKGVPDYGKDAELPWFTEFKLNPMYRLLRQIISEAVNKYINLGDLDNLTNENGKLIAKEQNFCLYHKGVVASAQLLKDELTVKARDRFMEMLDVTKRETKLRTERILAQLEHDVKQCMDRNETFMRTHFTKVQTLSQGDCVLCKETRIAIPWPSHGQKEGRALVGSDTNLAHTVVADDKYKGKKLVKTFLGPVDFVGVMPEEPCMAKPMEEPQEKRTTGGGGGRGDITVDPNCDTDSINLNKLICQRGIGISDEPCSERFNHKAFVIPGGELKPKPQKVNTKPKCDVILLKSQTRKSFFRATTSDLGPYKFKYHRVFQTERKPYDMKKHIAKTFVKALNKPIEQKISYIARPSCSRFICSESLGRQSQGQSQGSDEMDERSNSTDTSDLSGSHSQQSHIDYKAIVSDAVVKCVKKIWKYKEAIKREEMGNDKSVDEPIVLKYDIDYFDPNDEDLMDRMLADGMNELKKDPRFVLASLPESHKMPVLREWIKRRFGKCYTQNELLTELEESNRIFEIVQAMQSKPPKADLMGLDNFPAEEANYKYFNKVTNLGIKVKRAYIEKLNNIYMRQMNACWYAMGNYKNPAGPPRKIFYAYMASNPRDIIREHVWSGEFRNLKQLREFEKRKS